MTRKLCPNGVSGPLIFAAVVLLCPICGVAGDVESSVGVANFIQLLDPDLQADEEEIKSRGKEAVESLVAKFAREGGGADLKRFVIVPLPRDISERYLTLQLENAFAREGRHQGYELYTRDNEKVSQILKEVSWSEDYEDVMAKETVQKLGRIVGAEGVIVSRFDLGQKDNGEMVLRMNIQSFEVETLRAVWGDEVRTTWVPGMSQAGIERVLIIFGVVIAAGLAAAALLYVYRLITTPT